MLLTKAPDLLQAETPVAAATVRSVPQPWPFLLCELVVLGLVVRGLWWHAAAVRQHVGLPFQVDYEEGNILNALVRITHGQTPYPDPHGLPNILNPYGPVAYYLLVVPVKLFGISFLGPRLAIVACGVAICCFLGLAIARNTGSRTAGLLFGSLYGALALVQGWSTVLRVDLLALAFSVAGLYCCTRTSCTNDAKIFPNADSRWPMAVATSLFAAALLVKYTYIAAPAACALWLISRQQWRRAVRFVGGIAAWSAGVLALAAVATRGAVFTHLFLTHPDPFSWSVYLLRLTDVVARHRVLVALAGVLLISDLLRSRISLPALWLLLAALTAVTAGKLGSNWNHFLELPAAFCLCAAMGWTTLTRACAAPVSDPRAPSMRILLRPLAVAATVVAVGWLGLFVFQQRKLAYDPFLTVAECPQAYAFVKQHGGGHVLSENVGALVMAEKMVWVSNPFVYSQMVMRAGWPDAGLERMVRNREFDLVVAQWNYPEYPPFMSDGGERFSSGVLKAIANNYRVVQTYQCTDARFMFEKK